MASTTRGCGQLHVPARPALGYPLPLVTSESARSYNRRRGRNRYRNRMDKPWDWDMEEQTKDPVFCLAWNAVIARTLRRFVRGHRPL